MNNHRSHLRRWLIFRSITPNSDAVRRPITAVAPMLAPTVGTSRITCAAVTKRARSAEIQRHTAAIRICGGLANKSCGSGGSVTFDVGGAYGDRKSVV